MWPSAAVARVSLNLAAAVDTCFVLFCVDNVLQSAAGLTEGYAIMHRKGLTGLHTVPEENEREAQANPATVDAELDSGEVTDGERPGTSGLQGSGRTSPGRAQNQKQSYFEPWRFCGS